MRKITLGAIALLASSVVAAANPSAPTSSTIVLQGGGDLAPMGSMKVSIATLPKNVYYNVSCQITNSNPDPVDMRIQPASYGFMPYGQVILNDKVLDNLQGSVISGVSTVVVSDVWLDSYSLTKKIATNNKSGAPEMNEAYIQFKNLDQAHAVQVNSCVAHPAIKEVAKPKMGYFTAYNNTPYFVNMSVGNFFPTPYLISPFGSRFINVSTDNQDIYFDSIF